MIKRLIYFSLFLSILTISSGRANAAVDSQTIYGGGQNCVSRGEIDLDKKIKDPKTGKFVDNLSLNESKYRLGDQVTFEIKVTNTGDADFSSVEVKDIIPQYTSFVSGPGSFDGNTNTLTYSLKNLKTNESRTDVVVVKVTNEGNFCVVNQSSAISEGMSDQDNSQFCIEKVAKVLPPPTVKQTPPTGPEMLGLIGLIPAGLSGIYLRRRKLNAK